uniref:hypothetical protein n=1 Tax=Facilibium subflavum TaxID=2219058 RepID=UPI0013C335CB
VTHRNYRVALQYQKLSPEVIRKELLHVQVSILKHRKTEKKYGIPSATGAHAAKIYQTMGLSLASTPFVIVDNSM